MCSRITPFSIVNRINLEGTFFYMKFLLLLLSVYGQRNTTTSYTASTSRALSATTTRLITTSIALPTHDHEHEQEESHDSHSQKHASHGHSSHSAEDEDCSFGVLESYSVSYHIIGLFTLLACSTAGVFGTMLLGATKSKMGQSLLQICKMFGIGVIVASAWIHLLPEAFAMFTHPCLMGQWTEYGGSYVGLFAMIAAFIVQLIEANSNAHGDTSQVEKDTLAYVGRDEYEKESNISVVLLEAGIIFHSVIIGLNLGVESDEGFGVLLVAICFHQFFEGMALGALIALSRMSKITKASLCCLYSFTTPLGMALGIAVRNHFNVNSQHLILFQGILGSMSAGILMYNAYCELLSLEINHNVVFQGYTPRFKVVCFISMYLGASALAVIGIWI